MAGDLAGILGVLADAGVDFIVIDGLAAQAHGSARLTQYCSPRGSWSHYAF